MKTQIMAALLALSMSGCASAVCEGAAVPGKITMEAIIQANSSDILLSRYSSLLNHMESDYPGLIDLYVASDFCYEKNSEYLQLADTEDYWNYMDVDGEMVLVYDWFAMSDEEKSEYRITTASYKEPVVNGSSSLKETIESIVDNGDGTLTVATILKAEDSAELFREDGNEYPEAFYTSDQRLIYILDQETLEIHSCEQMVLAPDGDIPYVSYTITYNADQPEEMKTMIALVDEFKNGEKTSPRTITVVYDVGTEQEQTYSMTVDSKFKIIPYSRDGYDYAYTDPEKKEPYTGGDGINDITVYAFSEE